MPKDKPTFVGLVGPAPVRGGQRADNGARPFLLMFDVEGLPKAQPRAKSSRNLVGVYTPTTANDWKRNVRHECKRALEADGIVGLVPANVALGVDLVFRFPRPATHFRTGRYAGQLKPNAPKFHVPKPDRDNLDKAVLDALGNFDGCSCLVWCDDSQVAYGTIQKLYVRASEEPGVSVMIYSLEAR